MNDHTQNPSQTYTSLVLESEESFRRRLVSVSWVFEALTLADVTSVSSFTWRSRSKELSVTVQSYNYAAMLALKQLHVRYNIYCFYLSNYKIKC